MESISFKLDAFEGPLDLLLHLITKHKLNINDIEISLLLEQYLAYINDLEEQDFELAGEFLEMAARLIYIKTVSLLPQPEEADEMKKELQGRIIEYSICKMTAAKLREMFVGGDVFVREAVKMPVDRTYSRDHEADELYTAYMAISPKQRTVKPLRANDFNPIVTHRIVSVTSKIIYVMKRLYKDGKCEMTSLYDNVMDKSARVATFLAVLELTKSGRIKLNDDNSEIYFIRRDKKQKNQQIAENIYVHNDDEALSQFDDTDEYAGEDSPENTDIDGEYESSGISIPVYVATEKQSVEKSNKHYVKSSQERVYNTSVFTERIVVTQNDLEETEPAAEQINNVSQQIATQEIISDEIIENDFKSDNTPLDIVDEEPYVSTVFRPSYWSLLDYRWSNSPVGDDKSGNYWKYGNRIKGRM